MSCNKWSFSKEVHTIALYKSYPIKFSGKKQGGWKRYFCGHMQKRNLGLFHFCIFVGGIHKEKLKASLS